MNIYLDIINSWVYHAIMQGLTIAENIKILAARRGLSLSDLARTLGKSPQNFIQQVQRDDFRISDLQKIAAALGVRFDFDFVEIPDSQKA